MEYTKDIVLEISYKKEIAFKKIKRWTSKIKKGVNNNKVITITLTLLTTLIAIDFILINSFLKILTNIN